MIDSHCHLEFDHFNKDREKVIKKAKKELEAVIDSCVGPKDLDKVLQLHKKHPNFIYVSTGLHPKTAKNITNTELKDYKDQIRKNRDKVVAIGEIGLDYHHVRKPKDKEKTKTILEDMINFSNSLDLPIVIHSRNSMNDVMKILQKNTENNVIIHCFSGNNKNLKEALDRDYYVSIGGMIYRNPTKYKKLVKNTPLNKLLLETDAPFLAKKKQNRSNPWFIKQIAEKIAQIKNTNQEKILKTTAKNTKTAYNLPN